MRGRGCTASFLLKCAGAQVNEQLILVTHRLIPATNIPKIVLFNKMIFITELFLGFFQITEKKAADIMEDIFNVIERVGLDIITCRG